MRKTAATLPGSLRVALSVRESAPVMAAEDFSIYQQQVPGVFFFVGVRPPDVAAEAAIPNHSPNFYADEDALEDAVRAMASLAADYLDAR